MIFRQIHTKIYRNIKNIYYILRYPNSYFYHFRHTIDHLPRLVKHHSLKSKNPIISGIQTLLRSAVARQGVRSTSLLSCHWKLLTIDRSNGGWAFNKYVKRLLETNTFAIEHVQNLFGTNPRYNKFLNDDVYGNRLQYYEIGDYINKGACGAVFKLRKRDNKTDAQYPLALKMMFNYNEIDLSSHLMDEMKNELIPLVKISKDLKKYKYFRNIRKIPERHPNIIDLKTAFFDNITEELCKLGSDIFPEALPMMTKYGIRIPRETMFIVMKRYSQDLKQYNKTCIGRPIRTNIIIFGQLMEALSFLHKHIIAHRDIKNDNILLEYNNEGDVPFLVLGDFGLSHSTGSWELKYRYGMTKCGNIALQPPEISLADPGEHYEILNYEKSDVWSAGAVGYEIFEMYQPFYKYLNSKTYFMEDLPLLDKNIPLPIKKVMNGVLERKVERRMFPEVAGNIILLTLFQDSKIFKKFWNDQEKTLKKKINSSNKKPLYGDVVTKMIENICNMITAQTITLQAFNKENISNAELQLRATCLSRLNIYDMQAALNHFLN
ncbi:Serine/threonine-protein kinase PINK1,mitochondrial [Strongyloides ratti]|uniref:non-specific serine/threonine protein kinase n=1 Tax=Strongyloides ratti TaxID=34506 RepID=A0A090KRG7_STRRB|nr:Serine/threonine-protein kinase PINK1,mitochondrial [Strongyloides ratti]CEF59980.1 Serine/threonine-protein kinase PINK1,mitochondrial [Strongyloides ratti]